MRGIESSGDAGNTEVAAGRYLRLRPAACQPNMAIPKTATVTRAAGERYEPAVATMAARATKGHGVKRLASTQATARRTFRAMSSGWISVGAPRANAVAVPAATASSAVALVVAVRCLRPAPRLVLRLESCTPSRIGVTWAETEVSPSSVGGGTSTAAYHGR
jgi:hypothetical protein